MDSNAGSANGGIVLGAGMNRRALLRRAAALGAATPLVAGLLAACGGSSESTATTAATSESGGAASTSTSTTTPGATPEPSGSPTGEATGAKFEVEPAKNKGGQYVEGTFSDAKTLASVLSSDTTSGAAIAMVFDGVIQTSPETTEPMGRLAKSWEISDDGLTYSFVLQDGVKFHDGEPLTANDVKFTYGLMLNPDTNSPRYGTLKDRIDSIDVQDDTHFSIKLQSPNSSFLASNMGYQVMPEHILKDVEPSALAQHDFSKGKKGVTIGSGPFKFEEWVKDDHMTLVKNPDYWQGEPNLDRWILKVVPNQTVLVQQIKTGELDYGSIQEADAADMQKEQGVTVHMYNGFTFTYYGYQLDPAKTEIFQEKEVRQALAYALDRKAMIDAIRFGIGEAAVGTMPIPSWAYNPDGVKNKYEYDEDKAKELLDSAGWKPGSDGIREKNGKKLAFTIWTNSGNQVREQYVTVFQQQWKKIGVECTPKTQEWNAFLDRMNPQHDFDMFLVGFSWGVDPDQTTMWACDSYGGGFNDVKYCNPQVDKLLKDGLATTDKEERKQIYTEMQNILMEDLPQLILDFPKSIVGVNKRVHNVFPNAANLRFNAHQWWVDA